MKHHLVAIIGAILLFISPRHFHLEGATTAAATAYIINGFVVSINVNNPGSGYISEPKVTLIGGGGSGAQAKAILTNGTVSLIIVLNAGSGYTSTPTVEIESPLTAFYSEGIQMIPIITFHGKPGVACQIQAANAIGNGATNWFALTNLILPDETFYYLDLSATSVQSRFYRILPLSAILPYSPDFNPNPSKLVWISPGAFFMGSVNTESGRRSDESPRTKVILTTGFWMSKYEVTQSEFVSLMNINPSVYGQGSSNPVDNVTWEMATNYCYRLTEQERAWGRLPPGCVYRLPAEAEWEYACRAGTTNSFYFGDSSSDLSKNAWNYSNSANTTHAVGLKLPNQWGLYDIVGNVWEWCLDWYGPYPGGTVLNPTGPSTGISHCVRGGCMNNYYDYCRSAGRHKWPPNGSYTGTAVTGFRVVLAPPL